MFCQQEVPPFIDREDQSIKISLLSESLIKRISATVMIQKFVRAHRANQRTVKELCERLKISAPRDFSIQLAIVY